MRNPSVMVLTYSSNLIRFLDAAEHVRYSSDGSANRQVNWWVEVVEVLGPRHVHGSAGTITRYCVPSTNLF